MSDSWCAFILEDLVALFMFGLFFPQSPWSISREFDWCLASWLFCHSMETAWEFNTYSSIILVGKLLFAFASDEACVHAAARSTQGSKGNAFTGGDFAAAPCPFPSCWRQPTRANRNELAGRTNKEKCVMWHSWVSAHLLCCDGGQPINWTGSLIRLNVCGHKFSWEKLSSWWLLTFSF